MGLQGSGTSRQLSITQPSAKLGMGVCARADVTPIFFMWEKLIGTHEKPAWIRLPSRIPVGESAMTSLSHMCELISWQIDLEPFKGPCLHVDGSPCCQAPTSAVGALALPG
jgi:hypothetical protein